MQQTAPLCEVIFSIRLSSFVLRMCYLSTSATIVKVKRRLPILVTERWAQSMIPVYRQSARSHRPVHPAVGCHYFPPGLLRVGPGQPPLSLHFPTSSHSTLYLVSFPFPFFPSYSLHLFSCFSIPPRSIRIVPLCFQAGCHKRRLKLALVFVCVDFMLYVFFS